LFAEEQIASNPAALLHLAKTTPNCTIPITQAEVTTLLKSINHPLATRDELLFAMYAYTGIRRSEALRLRVDDYDQLIKTMHIYATKGGGNRLQPVPTRLAYILERYIERQHCDDAPFLFPGANALKPLSTRQAHNRFDRWKGMAGSRRGLTIHSFRAGFATILYQTTGDIWLVSHALGHASLQTIRHYIQTDAAEISGAVERAFTAAG
jgi:integrase